MRIKKIIKIKTFFYLPTQIFSGGYRKHTYYFFRQALSNRILPICNSADLQSPHLHSAHLYPLCIHLTCILSAFISPVSSLHSSYLHPLCIHLTCFIYISFSSSPTFRALARVYYYTQLSSMSVWLIFYSVLMSSIPRFFNYV